MRARLSLLVVVALLVAAPLKELRFLGRAELHAQAGAPNGNQFNLTVTSGAIVQLTVPQGTTFCTVAVSTNAINYDVGKTNNPAPTTTTGIPANPGALLQFASFFNCRNFGAIAQGANATLNSLYFR